MTAIALPPFKIAPTDLSEVSRLVSTVLDRTAPKTADEATEVRVLLAQVKATTNRLETARKAVLAPLKSSTDAINTEFAKVKTPLAEVEATLKAMLESYLHTERQKAQAQAAQIAEAQVAPAPGDRLTPAIVSMPVLEPTAVIHTRKTHELVVVDASLIPREYLVPDLAKIKAALAGGVPIPGCKLEVRESIVAR